MFVGRFGEVHCSIVPRIGTRVQPKNNAHISIPWDLPNIVYNGSSPTSPNAPLNNADNNPLWQFPEVYAVNSIDNEFGVLRGGATEVDAPFP